MSNAHDTRAWVEVDLDAVRANFGTVAETARPRVGVLPMVKANGYGLGAERLVRALEPLSPWGFGVAAVAEGIALRELGVERTIVVFSPVPVGEVEAAADADLVPAISDLGGLERWAEQGRRRGRPLAYHLEIDTGMGRCGFDWREVGTWGPAVRDASTARCAGVFTHFHSADEADPSVTEVQWERFQDALVQLGVDRDEVLVHAANSAASVRWPELGLDLVRPGIFLYGVQAAVSDELAPRPVPVVAVRSRIILVKEVPAGTTVGYGATHAAERPERWGTLAIGYGDGLPRALGNRGSALVRGRRVPIIGRISMDLTVVDLTDVPDAGVDDVVTLMGTDGAGEIRVEEVAGIVGTIGYEILAGLGQRLPRVEVGRG